MSYFFGPFGGLVRIIYMHASAGGTLAARLTPPARSHFGGDRLPHRDNGADSGCLAFGAKNTAVDFSLSLIRAKKWRRCGMLSMLN